MGWLEIHSDQGPRQLPVGTEVSAGREPQNDIAWCHPDGSVDHDVPATAWILRVGRSGYRIVGGRDRGPEVLVTNSATGEVRGLRGRAPQTFDWEVGEISMTTQEGACYRVTFNWRLSESGDVLLVPDDAGFTNEPFTLNPLAANERSVIAMCRDCLDNPQARAVSYSEVARLLGVQEKTVSNQFTHLARTQYEDWMTKGGVAVPDSRLANGTAWRDSIIQWLVRVGWVTKTNYVEALRIGVQARPT